MSQTQSIATVIGSNGDPCTPDIHGIYIVALTTNDILIGNGFVGAIPDPNSSGTLGYEVVIGEAEYPFPQCSGIINTCTSDIQFLMLKINVDESFLVTIPGDSVLYYNGGLTFTAADWQTTIPDGCSPIVPCIPAGQKVLTPNGYQLIETLETGNFILTPDGRSVEIVISSFFIPIITECNAPILIPANTFAENSPINDIILSPDHCIMIKPNVWDIPRHLINKYNGIKKLNLGEYVTYYNIVTPNYLTDDIVVEGSVIESFGKNFSKKYPDIKNIYTYDDELKAYTRITMKDVIPEQKQYYAQK